MTTYGLDEVRNFTSDLEARASRCNHGEGMECATLDDALRLYANLCRQYRQEVRQWAMAVFAGQVAFDTEVERVWLEQGHRLFSRSLEMLSRVEVSAGPCYELEGQTFLESALWNLDRLLTKWVTPQIAVSPSVRQRIELTSDERAEIRRRLDAIPLKPVVCEPTDPSLRNQNLREKTFSMG